jgi:hypothetical protein
LFHVKQYHRSLAPTYASYLRFTIRLRRNVLNR